MSITRKLNLREKRRLRMHAIVPVDALDPSCSARELIENKTTHLYRYGCYFQDTNVELEEYFSIPTARSSSRFHLRGFHHHLTSNLYIFIANIFKLYSLSLSRALLEKFVAWHFIIIIINVASSIS